MHAKNGTSGDRLGELEAERKRWTKAAPCLYYCENVNVVLHGTPISPKRRRVQLRHTHTVNGVGAVRNNA
jgi:hypothetical protein